MARAAPEDPFAGLADPAQLARDVPDLDLLDPDLPTVAQLEERAQRAESAGLAVKGVTKSGGASASAGIGGMVLVTSQRLPRRLSQFRPERVDDGDRGRRHRDGARLRLFLRAAWRRSRAAREGRPHGRRARGRAAQSAQGRDQARAGRVRPADRGLARRPSRQRDQRQPRSRARPASSRTSSASGCSSRASTSSTIRCASAACARARSMPRASRPSASRSSRTAC